MDKYIRKLAKISYKYIINYKVDNNLVDNEKTAQFLWPRKSGIRVNVCCRSGECSLCRVKFVSGKAYLANGMLLRFADSKFGYIHSCKSYPNSDLEIEF